MRVRIDMTRCRGHGICALVYPDGIDLDEWGYATTVVRAVDGRAARRRAQRAAAACPRGAIVLTEDAAWQDRSGDAASPDRGATTGTTAGGEARWGP